LLLLLGQCHLALIKQTKINLLSTNVALILMAFSWSILSRLLRSLTGTCRPAFARSLNDLIAISISQVSPLLCAANQAGMLSVTAFFVDELMAAMQLAEHKVYLTKHSRVRDNSLTDPN